MRRAPHLNVTSYWILLSPFLTVFTFDLGLPFLPLRALGSSLSSTTMPPASPGLMWSVRLLLRVVYPFLDPLSRLVFVLFSPSLS
jgi:hypothetical protein